MAEEKNTSEQKSTQRSSASKVSILAEFWEFLKVRKKWWLMPIVLFLVLLGALIVFTQGSPLATFIYTIF